MEIVRPRSRLRELPSNLDRLLSPEAQIHAVYRGRGSKFLIGFPRPSETDAWILHIFNGTRALCRSNWRSHPPHSLSFSSFLTRRPCPRAFPRPLAPSSSVLAQPECISSSFIPLLVKLIINLRLTGVVCAQVQIYFRRYQRDNLPTRLMVSTFLGEPSCSRV